MKLSMIASLTIVLAGAEASRGQVSGNVAFAQGGGRARAEQAEVARRNLTRHELPPSPSSTFIEARILANVKADEYVATFALAHEGDTVAACNTAMEATLAR